MPKLSELEAVAKSRVSSNRDLNLHWGRILALASHPSRPVGGHNLIPSLLVATLPLFLGALLADWAYFRTFEIQWLNFAAWLNAGAMVLAVLAFIGKIVSILVFGARRTRDWLCLGLVLATLVFGLLAALVHARDAWATMPAGLLLSAVVFVLALVATWAAFSRRIEGIR